MKGILYALITPAHNEEEYIERTIESVIAQTISPSRWVIVSDGSTDGTDDIVAKYAVKHDFMQLVRIDRDPARNFGSAIRAINTGYEQLKGVSYDFVGNLDADVVLQSDYYESILDRFQANSKLGIAGGIVCDRRWDRFDEKFTAVDSARGPIQMFRRECYEQIGGHSRIGMGGYDTVAEIKARMYGWQVRTFPEIKALHLRPTGTAKGSVLWARFHQGKIEYRVRYHPLFEIAKCLSRVREKPYFFGSLFRLSGYCYSLLWREQPVVSEDVVRYLRCEQLSKLKSLFKRR
jgi:glycosyltransferase involved in cell wall biosynthesis